MWPFLHEEGAFEEARAGEAHRESYIDCMSIFWLWFNVQERLPHEGAHLDETCANHYAAALAPLHVLAFWGDALRRQQLGLLSTAVGPRSRAFCSIEHHD